MGKTCGLSGVRVSGHLLGAMIIGACMGLPGANQSAKASETDKLAALINANKVPLPAIHPRRKNARNTNTKAVPSNGVSKKDVLSTAHPALPIRNPLRRLKTNLSSLQTGNINHATPPLPTRNALISDRVKALAPILHYTVSRNDISALKQSIEHVLKSRFTLSKMAQSKIADRTARKLAQWYYLRKSTDLSDPLAIRAFRQKNPDWPSRSLLRRRFERALLETDADTKTILAQYRQKPPVTGTGKYLLARAYMRTGKRTKARKLIRSVWHTHSLGTKIEKSFVKEFGEILTKADHRRRADHFLYKDHRRHLPAVRRVKKHLSKAEEEKVNLRMEVIKRRLNAADKEYQKLGAKALKDNGLLFNKIQLLRRKKKFDASRKLLRKAPVDAKGMVEPNEWWIERRLQTRYALRHNKPHEAYRIASRHGKISRKNLCEAEFLAGWIALTRLNKAKLAARHFALERKNAKSRTEIAKAEYWLGRLKLKQKDTIGALAHFAASAKYFRTYYGQLSLQSIEGQGRLKPINTPVPSKRDVKRFINRDAVRALIIAHKAGLNGLMPLFFNQLAWRLDSPGEMILLAELASQIHSKRGAVITGKIGIHRGFKLDRYAYPVNALPHFDRLTANVDNALVLALVRQESEFNARAKSPVGARGMMQIMPGTARIIARQHKVRYSRSKLVNDPSYNIALGVAHLHDLIKKYNGSYILPLVAYNAGPGRVRDWIEAFGDPRDPNIDSVNWIESIPFSETRRYVQRIMSSAQIFRARANEGSGRIKLIQDINRGQTNELAKTPHAAIVKVNFTNR